MARAVPWAGRPERVVRIGRFPPPSNRNSRTELLSKPKTTAALVVEFGTVAIAVGTPKEALKNGLLKSPVFGSRVANWSSCDPKTTADVPVALLGRTATMRGGEPELNTTWLNVSAPVAVL